MKAADELMQKEVVRKLRKWDAVCRKASKDTRVAASSDDSIDSTPTSTSSLEGTESMEVNRGMQLPLSKAVDKKPESTSKEKASKSLPKDGDWYETDYYLMTPLERQECRESRANGGVRRRRPTMQANGEGDVPTSACKRQAENEKQVGQHG